MTDLATISECKVAGCTSEAAQQRGRYAGLCVQHRYERIEADKAAPVVEEPPPNGKQPLPRELRLLLLDLVLVDDLDIDQVRLDAARILLRTEKA